MRDGLKIYACTGFGVGTAPADFNYWTDNTETITNTCAVNSLLADINFHASKLRYAPDMTDEEALVTLNVIDLYVVCLYGAEQYDGKDLERFGRIIGQMVDAGMFHYDSTDNDERDANLDELISIAETRFNDGEDPQISNDTTMWFYDYVVARDYVGLNEKQIAAAREAINASNAVSGATTNDAGEVLHSNGGYYLYQFMTRKQAYDLGAAVYAKWKKEKEMYEYIHKAYDSMYGGKEEVDKVIYAGICAEYGHTPERLVYRMCENRIEDGVGCGISAICTAIGAIISLLTTVLSAILTIVSAVLESKYKAPEDPDFGVPGLGGEDLDEIRKGNTGEKAKTVVGLALAAALLFFGISKD